MIRRRNLLILVIIAVIIFVITTNYLLLNLQTSDIEVRKLQTIEDKIYMELQSLPDYYKLKPFETVQFTDLVLAKSKNRTVNLTDTNLEYLWKEANSWVSKTGIVDFSSTQIINVLSALKNAKITKADFDTRGTQLKLLLTLQVK